MNDSTTKAVPVSGAGNGSFAVPRSVVFGAAAVALVALGLRAGYALKGGGDSAATTPTAIVAPQDSATPPVSAASQVPFVATTPSVPVANDNGPAPVTEAAVPPPVAPTHHARQRTVPSANSEGGTAGNSNGNNGSTASGEANGSGQRAVASVCTNCGVVESANVAKVKGEGTGLGAVAGGVLGGVVGNRFGAGNGKAAMTVLGAVGGGLAGHEVEKRVRGHEVYDVSVRMEDGSTRTIEQATAPAIGSHVVVDGQTLRSAGSAEGQSHMVRTNGG